MRYTRKILVLLALSGVAAIGTWQWWRLEARSALPPEEAGAVRSQGQIVSPQPQQSNYMADAKADSSEWARRNAARKNANDIESVTRTFKEANDCRLYHTARHELGAMLNDERLDDLSGRSLAFLEHIDATSSRYLTIARQTEALCAGTDPDELARVYSDAILKAALMGNPDAESCFVTGDLYPIKITSDESQRYFDDRYLRYAPNFMQNALKRGDPHVAAYALYRQLPPQGGHLSVVDNLPKADPYLTVKMARLAALRALPENRKIIDDQLTMFEELNLLEPEEFKRAQAWALETYEREFAGQPPINLYSQPHCYSSPDLAP
jgi:hypothetical protein